MQTNLIRAIQKLKQGHPVIIIDEKRENEGDLVVAAQVISMESVNFMMRHSSGVICVATTSQQIQRLRLTTMLSSSHKPDSLSTPFTFSCEAALGIGTGISAKDRARSIQVMANPEAKPEDIVVPGHIFPLQAKDDGLKAREGHTEASVALCQIAGLWPSAAIAEIPDENGLMLTGENLQTFARTYRLEMVSIAEIKQFLKEGHSLTSMSAYATLPTIYGTFQISIWNDLTNPREHIALVMGDVKGKKNVPVRMHSECLTGDLFHSKKCDCGEQLEVALRYIQEKGCGMLIWLRQEGRGIGLTNKIKAYFFQETENLDTVEANLKLGLPVDARTFDSAIEILKYFGPESIELLTNNPEKVYEIEKAFPGKITRKEVQGTVYKENINYLKTKQKKLNHILPIDKEEGK